MTTENIFLTVANKHLTLSKHMELPSKTNSFYPTNVLFEKAKLFEELNIQGNIEIIEFLDKRKAEIKTLDKEKQVIEFLSQLNVSVSNYKSLRLSINKLLSLDLDRYRKSLKKTMSMYNGYYSNTINVYYGNQRNEHENIYAKHPAVQALYYEMNHELLDRLKLTYVFPNKTIKNIHEDVFFEYFAALHGILNKVFNDTTEFELTHEEDTSLKDINDYLSYLRETSYTFETLKDVLKTFVKYDIPMEDTKKYMELIKNHKESSHQDVLDFGFSYYDNFECTNQDYLFIENLLDKFNEQNIDKNLLSKKRVQEIINYLKEQDLYNLSILNNIVSYFTNDEEINIKLSEQSKTFNKLVEFLNDLIYIEGKTVFTNALLNISKLNLKKSKAFMQLLDKNFETLNVLKEMTQLPLLFSENLFDKVHVNMITDKTLDVLVTKKLKQSVENEMNTLVLKEKLTPELFIEMSENVFKVKLTNLLLMKEIKKDMIIRILKSFNNIKKGQHMITDEIYLEVIESMTEKEINQLFQFRNHYSKTMDRDTAFMIHLLKNKFVIFGEVDSVEELDFLLVNDDNLGTSITAMLETILDSRKEYKEFKSKLEASDTFFETNKLNLIKFFTKGLHRIVNDYVENSATQQVKNAYLLAKAEIANRLYDVKFQNIENELEENLTDDFKDKWKTLLTKTNRFRVEELVDFKTLFMLGENPVRSCMNYQSGQYKHCLLSIFDSTKQYIAVYDKDKLVGRAILRLTKTVDVDATTRLGFVDVENLEDEKQVKKKHGEAKPILFLENVYTSYTNENKQKMKQEIVALVKEKAALLGVEFIASGSYSDVLPKGTDTKNIFITHSQNGNQYLDSFGGSHSENAGGVYKTTTNYTM